MKSIIEYLLNHQISQSDGRRATDAFGAMDQDFAARLQAFMNEISALVKVGKEREDGQIERFDAKEFDVRNPVESLRRVDQTVSPLFAASRVDDMRYAKSSQQ